MARVFSGIQPSGELHLGNYLGAVRNWVRLQDQHECLFCVVDLHAITQPYEPATLSARTLEMATGLLATGLDPDKCTLFVQSHVPEHSELNWLLTTVTPLGELERQTQYKDKAQRQESVPAGLLNYPILQAADVLLYHAGLVPVGEDQVSHVEISREIVRRFNAFYGLAFKEKFKSFVEYLRSKNKEATDSREAVLFDLFCRDALGQRGIAPSEDLAEIKSAVREMVHRFGVENFVEKYGGEFVASERVLTEPDVMLTKTPRIPGLDGRKMSKSYGNAITLSESGEEIRKKTKMMVTDPARKRRTDPGNPDVCPVYDWHKLFSSPETLKWSAEGCRTAGIGCIECKAKMADHLIEWIAPIRERRVEYERHPARVLDVIDSGSAKAREVAQVTMKRVRQAVFDWDKKRKEVSGS